MSALLLNPTQAATNLFNFHNLALSSEELDLFLLLKVFSPCSTFTCIHHNALVPDWYHHRCPRLLMVNDGLAICKSWKELWFYVGDPLIKDGDGILQRYLTNFLCKLLCAEHAKEMDRMEPLVLKFRDVMMRWRREYFLRRPEETALEEQVKSSPIEKFKGFFGFGGGKKTEPPRTRSPSPMGRGSLEGRRPRPSVVSSGSSTGSREQGSLGVLERTSIAFVKLITNRQERMVID